MQGLSNSSAMLILEYLFTEPGFFLRVFENDIIRLVLDDLATNVREVL